MQLDIYTASFVIPDLIFALAASLVSVTILMPFLFDRMNRDNQEDLRSFLDTVFTVFSVSIILICILVGIFMPFLIKYIVPGFHTDALHTLVNMSRLMLLSPILLGLSNLFGTIIQARKKFLVYALSPIFYNLGIILGISIGYKHFGILGLTLGVIVGAIGHMALQWFAIDEVALLPRYTRTIDWKLVRDIVRISIPRTLTLSCNQISLAVLYGIASHMVSGSISIFKFSLTLQAFPITIIGMSYAVASFPTLVEHFTKKDFTQFADAIITPVRQIIFWSLPIIVLFVLLRAQIVRVVLGVGNFDWSDTRLVAASLAILVFGIVAQGIMNVLVRGYYAAGKTWRPLLINGLSTVVTIIVAYVGIYWYTTHAEYALLFARILRVSHTNGVEVLILSLAYMFGTLFNGFVLWILFKKEFLVGHRSIISGVVNSVIASILLGITTYGGLQIVSTIFDLSTFVGVFTQAVCAGAMGTIVAGLFLYAREDEEFMRMWEKVVSLKKKLVRK